MKEIIIAIIAAGLTTLINYFLFKKKNKIDEEKGELDVLRDSLRVFKEFNEELTKKVDELKNEVNTLRDINEKLQLELDNLQNIIKQRR